MTPRDKRILDDLASNLRDKVIRDIADYVSLCCSAELEQRVVMTEVMQLLVRLTSSFAASQFHVSPKEFADVMGQQFERAQQAEAEDD